MKWYSNRFGKRLNNTSLFLLTIVIALLVTACDNSPSNTLVIYTSLDRHLSEPVIKAFEQSSGIKVNTVYDTEANKTTGLFNRLLAEKKRPRADIFWNSEISKSIALKEQGISMPFNAQKLSQLSPIMDPEQHWLGLAARERVVLYNTQLIKQGDLSGTLEDFFDPKWKGKTAIANPMFGTTASQFTYWYNARGKLWLLATVGRMMENDVNILPGNAQVKDQVAAGRLAFGLVDTDDAWLAIDAGAPVKILHLNDAADGLVIPNTLVKIKNGPNPDAADAFFQYMVMPHVEHMLLSGSGKQIPIINPVNDAHQQTVQKLKGLSSEHFKTDKNILDAIQQFLDNFKD